MPTILITGASRGLGLEFARQYVAAGWRVHACARQVREADRLLQLASGSAGLVQLHDVDLLDHGQIDGLAQELRDEPLDVLLNNAGVYGPNKMILGQIDYRAWREVLNVNTLAPLKIAEAFANHVFRSERKAIVSISSTMGSIARNTEGRHYLYRSSKSALNAVVKSMAIDLRPEGVIAVAICPGWVQTDMGGSEAPLTPRQSVSAICQLIDRLTLADSGKFLSHDGTEIPW